MNFLSTAFPLAAGVFALGLVSSAVADEALPAFVSQIDAKAIAVISDGDFRASSYRDGQLAAPSPERRDLLTVIRPGRPASRVAVPASNSVTGPPEVMALSPDGHFVYVVERLGQRSEAVRRVRDLPPGRRISAIDIRNPAKPRIAGTAEAGPMLESVRVSPDGRFLALTANSADDAMVQILPTNGGRLGAPQSFKLSELGIARREGAPRGSIDATFADWHPSGRFLSVNLNTRNQILFLAVTAAPDGKVTLAPWGAPVEVGRDPFVGRFTPDGGHYLSADWGRDFQAGSLEGRLPSAPSRLSLIRLAPREHTGRAARHEVAVSVDSDRSSEGLAISRDGRHVATVNMRETALAPDSPRYTRQASVSYFRFDPERSALTKIGDYPFEGMLPEGGSFDASGRHFLASVFEYADSDAPQGGVEVWRVGDAASPGLTHLGRIPVPHGAHHVELAP
ncbi:lactonase family protein [Variovorax sp. DT-64]|uniref:lactonase family protein n=1 Tax=Variovorax sp. DT-64 TaxID=3396160 RepID=UPI003F1D3C32